MGSVPTGASDSHRVNLERGAYAEQLACDYLLRQGLTLIEQNFRTKCGEIDLIMHDRSTLIFVEVRYRQNEYFCSALESVTWRKQQRIIRAANIFSLKNNLAKFLLSRFDIVTLTGNLRNPKIEWIEDAFSVD